MPMGCVQQLDAMEPRTYDGSYRRAVDHVLHLARNNGSSAIMGNGRAPWLRCVLCALTSVSNAMNDIPE